MSEFLYITKEIWKGNSVTRAYLNLRLSQECLKGKTIDVGGGKGKNYVSFIKRRDDLVFETFDLKVGKEVDFEKDSLPANSGTYDTVLFLNVMEHIFNYPHIANEVVRITKPGGQLIGFVPFLMWYHPDHHDFFRYTHESIEKIFVKAGAKNIKIEEIGAGPFIAAAQMILLSIPKLIRVPVFTFFYLFDGLYGLIKKDRKKSHQLGYFFKVTS